MIISLVAAVAANRVIGRAGGLPWRLPDDLKRFKQLTIDHTVIMGRKTFDEIKRPLANRRNVVISRDPEFRPHGATVVPSLEEALALGATEGEVFVIGGAEIYRLALPFADRIYLTAVHADVEGDTLFPAFDADGWVLEDEEHHPADDRHPFAFTYRNYRRVRAH
ncbi:MAG: dihydrofolate reductase [Gemmatimonadales bacterium]